MYGIEIGCLACHLKSHHFVNMSTIFCPQLQDFNFLPPELVMYIRLYGETK